MSGALETLLKFHNWWNGVLKVKANLQREASPLRFGVLGAAQISYSALFDAIDTHPGAVLTAIAARSLARARDQIAKYKLKDVRAYGSYDELLADDQIDAVYVPLPNGLHCEWAIKAMEAGKHVLIEKPICANADEVRRVRQTSESTGKIALEAYHWRFHPAAHTARALVTSGRYGRVRSIATKFSIPSPVIREDDIRFSYALAGGACMDLAYVFSATCYFAGLNADTAAQDDPPWQFQVHTATPRLSRNEPRIDEAMEAHFSIIPNPSDQPQNKIDCTVSADLRRPKLWSLIPRYWDFPTTVTVDLDRARVEFTNFVGPWFNHSIVTTEKDDASGNLLNHQKKTEKCYVGGPIWGGDDNTTAKEWWTTYRYQLEAFVATVRAREESRGRLEATPWLSLDESVKVMELTDLVVEKAGLPRRGK